MVKLLKEHNELRYHRLTNVLSSLVKVTFEDTFLVKAHFLKHPGQVLLSIYFFCVFGLGYAVYVCERAAPDVNVINRIDLEVSTRLFPFFLFYSKTTEHGLARRRLHNQSRFWRHRSQFCGRPRVRWTCFDSRGNWLTHFLSTFSLDIWLSEICHFLAPLLFTVNGQPGRPGRCWRR